jgi:hypothetical protein
MVLIVTVEETGENDAAVGEDFAVAGEDAPMAQITDKLAVVVGEDAAAARKIGESSTVLGCWEERIEWTVGHGNDAVGVVVGLLGLVMTFAIA